MMLSRDLHILKKNLDGVLIFPRFADVHLTEAGSVLLPMNHNDVLPANDATG